MKLPAWLQRAKEVWLKITYPIGFVVSKVILTALWLVVFGLYAVALGIGKLFSKKTSTPQWHDVPPDFEGSMRRQF